MVWTLLWVFSFYLGSFLGVNPLHSLETVHRYLTILLILFVGGMEMGPLEIRKFLSAFGWGTVICAIYGIGKHLFLHQERIDSFSGDKMVFGGLLMTALLIQFGFLMKKPKDLLPWAGVFLNGWALVLTETRGAWIGFFAGFLIAGLEVQPQVDRNGACPGGGRLLRPTGEYPGPDQEHHPLGHPV